MTSFVDREGERDGDHTQEIGETSSSSQTDRVQSHSQGEGEQADASSLRFGGMWNLIRVNHSEDVSARQRKVKLGTHCFQ